MPRPYNGCGLSPPGARCRRDRVGELLGLRAALDLQAVKLSLDGSNLRRDSFDCSAILASVALICARTWIGMLVGQMRTFLVLGIAVLALSGCGSAGFSAQSSYGRSVYANCMQWPGATSNACSCYASETATNLGPEKVAMMTAEIEQAQASGMKPGAARRSVERKYRVKEITEAIGQKCIPGWGSSSSPELIECAHPGKSTLYTSSRSCPSGYQQVPPK